MRSFRGFCFRGCEYSALSSSLFWKEPIASGVHHHKLIVVVVLRRGFTLPRLDYVSLAWAGRAVCACYKSVRRPKARRSLRLIWELALYGQWHQIA